MEERGSERKREPARKKAFSSQQNERSSQDQPAKEKNPSICNATAKKKKKEV
jgi:hypothetical protein